MTKRICWLTVHTGPIRVHVAQAGKDAASGKNYNNTRSDDVTESQNRLGAGSATHSRRLMGPGKPTKCTWRATASCVYHRDETRASAKARRRSARGVDVGDGEETWAPEVIRGVGVCRGHHSYLIVVKNEVG